MISPEKAATAAHAGAPYSGGLSRHERDAVSLMGGLLLVLVGAAFLLGDLTELSIDGRWVAPVVLLVVGAAGLLATLRPRGTGESDSRRN